MNELKISVVNGTAHPFLLKIDGKEVPIRRGKHGRAEARYCLQGTSARVRMETYEPMRGKLWWFVSLFYFLISCFGIFDERKNRRSRAIEFEAELLGGEYLFRILSHKEGEKAVEMQSGGEISVLENRSYIDETVRRRKKIMRGVKAVATAAIFLAIVLLAF